jgi:hypothetical protein
MLETKDDATVLPSQIESDSLLAWRIQAEEYKRVYQIATPSSFLSAQKSNFPSYQFQNPEGEAFSFILKPTAGDGDCFFYAVGKKATFTRDVLVQKLLDNPTETVRHIFAYEIRQFLYLGFIVPHPNSRENGACQRLLTADIRERFLILQKTEEELRVKIDKARSELGQKETHEKHPPALLDLLRQKSSSLASEFEQAYNAVLKVDNAIYQYCCQEDIFRRYVELYLKEARGYIPFSRDFSGERHITTIDAINELFGLKIQVYLPLNPSGTQLQLANQFQTGEVIPIFHNGINHFWGLEKQKPLLEAVTQLLILDKSAKENPQPDLKQHAEGRAAQDIDKEAVSPAKSNLQEKKNNRSVFVHFNQDNAAEQIRVDLMKQTAKLSTLAEAAARESLRVDPGYASAPDLLQAAQRHLPIHELKSEAENTPKHQARDVLHAGYLRQLSSEASDMRQDGFRQLIQALSRCKNSKEIDCLTELMSEENFKALLIKAPECLADEMPERNAKLQADCEYNPNPHTEQVQRQATQSFEDCLILYLATRLSAITEDSIIFYQNISQVLASKGYYYEDIPAKDIDTPIDALDYGLLASSNDLLDYYAEGARQIVVEYHYQQGIAVLQSAEQALKNLNTAIMDADVEKVTYFLEQFDLLLKIAKTGFQYSHPVIQALQEKHQLYLSNPVLLAVFSKIFRFKLNHHQTDLQLLQSECELLLTRIDLWSQYALTNAKKALRTFNAYLDEELSQDRFYGKAKKQTQRLLSRLENNQPVLEINAQFLPDLNLLAQKMYERYKGLLTISQDLNKRPIAALQKQIVKEAKTILTDILSTIENILGDAPCTFSLLGLGSYSREEMSLCSDINFAVLVSDESFVQHPYFKSFVSLLVHLRRGLSSPRVFTIDSKDLQTHFGQEKSLIHTPADMVSAHCPLYTETVLKSKKSRLTNKESYSVRRASLIFNSQTQLEKSKILYEDYQSQLTKQLQIRDEIEIPYYQRIGQVCFEEDFRKQDGSKVVDTPLRQNQSQTINLKKTHLRPLTLWLLDAATYFGIRENNVWAILDVLKQESRLSPLFLKELGEALTYVHTLRLKLHHAWLILETKKPTGLLFDMWFKMPQDYNTALPTRDFYLDAAQQDALDAIERRIIVPFTETVSVFGATLPVPQFDPIVLYFEQQLQILRDVEPKYIVEAHYKVLRTLAEIALTRPHLLMPNYTFRDLLPQLKTAYLDALEEALETIKASSTVKEVEELKILVQTLWHYPTEDGWRAESFRRERAWHQQLMHLVSAEIPVSASNTLSFIQGNTLKHYALKPEIISQLLTTQGEWQPKDKKITGNHLVYRITDQTETLCWAKIYPEQPGIEWLMLHLDQRLGVYGIPASTLVNFHHNGQNTAVLLSAHVPYSNLLTILETMPQNLANLDHVHFFKTLMRVLLSNPEDDKGDDYFLDPQADGLKLIRIDNERAFFAPESVEGVWRIRKLQVKSILYCLDLLTEPLRIGTPSVDAAIKDFLRLKPYALLRKSTARNQGLTPLMASTFF